MNPLALADEMLDEGRRRVESLPPLPQPNHKQMCAEACMGNFVVGLLIVIFVGFGHLMSPASVWLHLLHAEAAVAICCLIGLMFGDPGVVKRSLDTCLPLPDEVEQRLAASGSLDEVDQLQMQSNLKSDDGERTFCVRCLVWRPMGCGDVHHCRICNRCVTHFDHHCGVFGRCIAGNGFGGNFGYFKVIICMVPAALITVICAINSGDKFRLPYNSTANGPW